MISFVISYCFFLNVEEELSLKNSYLEASLSQVEFMGTTRFCQDQKKKNLYTVTPTLLLAVSHTISDSKWKYFYCSFFLYLKERGERFLGAFKVWGCNFITQKKWSETPQWNKPRCLFRAGVREAADLHTPSLRVSYVHNFKVLNEWLQQKWD